MPKRNKYIFDPKLNEYLYGFICSLTHEQKARLNNQELRYIKNKSSIRKFVSMENLEKLLIVLSKVGMECNLTLSPPNALTSDLVKKAYRQYSMKGKSGEVIDEMVKRNVFVFSTRDVAISLAMMNMNCHSSAFIINMEFVRVRKATNDMAANISKGQGERNINRLFNSGYAGLNVVASVINEAMLLDNYLASVHNLQPLDMILLNYFFRYPNNYVSLDKVKRDIKNSYKPQSIGIRATHLWKQRLMLDKMPAKEDVASYRITQEGILTVGAIANQIVNMASANFGT